MDGHYTFEHEPAGNTLQIEWYVLHGDTSYSNGWDAAAARVCRTLIEEDGSSPNKQCFEFESTL